MITESPLLIEPLTELKPQQSWNQQLKQAIRTLPELLEAVDLELSELNQRQQACADFPLLVPRSFVERMEKGNPNDPLLLQVLPQAQENLEAEGFIKDPLAEKHSNLSKGLIHKYNSRVLLIMSSGCAVNCRYCFRRHFPYSENRTGDDDWQNILQYLAADNSIEEVIFSGGDPLMMNDQQLAQRIADLEQIPHIERLRIHTRLPVVIPERITEQLTQLLSDTRFITIMVLHINHANELKQVLQPQLRALLQAGVMLLNQAVLLKGVNDTFAAQQALSKALISLNITPYYLHLLDKVQGAQHFAIADDEAIKIYKQMLNNLSGYLLPKLVREESGKGSKTPVIM
jgi:EF-P beta-lysylation protein EpmB